MKRMRIIGFSMLVTVFAARSLLAAIGTIGEPLSHRNLQVFPVHSETELEDRHYVTLSEAMVKGMVVVRETGNVNELSIENISKNRTIFLNAGDIVKGGRQDRTIRDDLILTSRSGAVPLSSFCVEHGRWTRRGDESATAFSANSKALSSRKLKMASRYGMSQSEVWAGVAEQQSKLNDNVSWLAGKNVETRSPASASSLQLTLENKELDEVKKGYMKVFESMLDEKTDVIGFVYALNGEINSAEVYNNKALFKALWPKLLDATITEAIAEFKSGREFQPVQSADLKTFFETVLLGAVKERLVWKTTRVKTYTTPSTVLFETVDVDADNRWIHKSFINKSSEKIIVPLDSESGSARPRIQQREGR